jgi:hypothetical protein
VILTMVRLPRSFSHYRSLDLLWQQGYQPIPDSGAIGYGLSRPYVVEKAPSIPVAATETYVPTTLAAGQASSFPCEDSTLVSSYIGPYQPLHATQSMGAQPTSRESMLYPTNASGGNYFGPQSQASSRDVPASVASRTSSFVADHVMSTVPISGPYNNDMTMAMAGPQSLHRQGSIDDLTASGYGMMQGYAPDPAIDDGSQNAMRHQAASGLDVVFPNQKRPPARRGPFQDPVSREQTAQTRRIGSCIRCRMQRIRVSLQCGSCPSQP